jgi:hypothetical protein
MSHFLAGLIGMAIILGAFGLWSFIEHAWREGLATTVGNITGSSWVLAKWVLGIAAIVATCWWLGPMWSIIVLLVLSL